MPRKSANLLGTGTVEMTYEEWRKQPMNNFGSADGLGPRLRDWAQRLRFDKSLPFVGIGLVADLEAAAEIFALTQPVPEHHLPPAPPKPPAPAAPKEERYPRPNDRPISELYREPERASLDFDL